MKRHLLYTVVAAFVIVGCAFALVCAVGSAKAETPKSAAPSAVTYANLFVEVQPDSHPLVQIFPESGDAEASFGQVVFFGSAKGVDRIVTETCAAWAAEKERTGWHAD